MTAEKEKSTKPLQVFLSYAKEDSAFASDLLKRLSQQPRFRVFTPDQMSAGGNWLSKIKREISRSDVFIALLSPAAVNSELFLSCLGAAWGLGKPIIPVVTSPEVISRLPVTLANVPVIDIKTLDTPEAIDQIVVRYEASAA